RSLENIKLVDELRQPHISIAAEIVMNHHETWFSQKQVKSEILYPLSWIASGIDGKVAVRHHGNVPHITDFKLVSLGRIAVHLCVYCCMEACVLQFGNCFLGKDPLWKDHYAIVRQPSSLLVERHPSDRLRGGRTELLTIGSAKLSRGVVAPMN